MHAYVFLHASMLYLNVCLSIFRLCHALCAPWVCACRSLRPLTYVVASVPLVVCFGCDHSWDTSLWCWCAWYTFFSAPCLPCLLCATCLAFIASLHLCMLAYMFMHEFVCCPYSNLMELWTPDQNLHLSPFCLITCLFAPVWLSLW